MSVLCCCRRLHMESECIYVDASSFYDRQGYLYSTQGLMSAAAGGPEVGASRAEATTVY